jgi:hypothetical protein
MARIIDGSGRRWPPAELWALSLGIVGFAAGFFGPIALNPDANQGPLLGIFVTGPGALRARHSGDARTVPVAGGSQPGSHSLLAGSNRRGFVGQSSRRLAGHRGDAALFRERRRRIVREIRRRTADALRSVPPIVRRTATRRSPGLLNLARIERATEQYPTMTN